MVEYKSEIVFQLQTPIFYQQGGDAKVEAREIILKAPSNKQRREVAKLKQGFFRAIGDLQEKSNNTDSADDSPTEINGEEIISAIMMSTAVDYCEYQETFRELLLNDVASVTEKQRLTSPLYESLAADDTELMMGEYISNFLLSSWMKKLSGK